MFAFRAFLATAWILLAVVTLRAVVQLGWDGGNVFFTDFAQPWRAQFNTDLSLHLLLFAGWILYREPRRTVGAACAIGVFFGGIFSLAYLLVATFRARGDVRVLLLGQHAAAVHH